VSAHPKVNTRTGLAAREFAWLIQWPGETMRELAAATIGAEVNLT
jgi:hypothetical protein